jgi:hypothetical protein
MTLKWYKRAKLNKESKLVCLDKDTTPPSEIEAVKLKDGCILFDFNLHLGHWGLLQELKRSLITATDMESVGYINEDGAYRPVAKGDEEVWDFFKK